MRAHESRCLAGLAVAVMTADDRVMPAEEEALVHLDTLGFGPVSRIARRAMHDPRGVPLDFRVACMWLAESGPRAAAAIVQALARLAASDGRVSLAEIDVLNDMARLLGLRVRDARHLLNAAIIAKAAGNSGLPAATRK